jgi:hypothetical protein
MGDIIIGVGGVGMAWQVPWWGLNDIIQAPSP